MSRERRGVRVERRAPGCRHRGAVALAFVVAVGCVGSTVPGALASPSVHGANAPGRLYIGTTSGHFGKRPITLRIAGGQVVGLTVYTDGSDPSTCGLDDLGPLPQRMAVHNGAFAGTRHGIGRDTEAVSGKIGRGSVSIHIVADHGSFSGTKCQIVHDAVLRPWSLPSGAPTKPRAGGRYSGRTDEATPMSFAVSQDAKSILRLRAALTMLCGGNQYGILIPGQLSAAVPVIASRITVGRGGGFAASLRYSGQTLLRAPGVFDGTLTLRLTGQFVGRSHAAVGTITARFAPSRSASQSGIAPCVMRGIAFEASEDA